jgi:uncharacterized protein YjiS (DUF1127 family)
MEDVSPRFAAPLDQRSYAMRAAITTDHTGHLAFGRSTPIFNALAAFLVRAVMRPIRFYKNRSEMAPLMDLSDHELRDIGLTRADLITVSGMTSDADPTMILARTVQERHRWRRGG